MWILGQRVPRSTFNVCFNFSFCVCVCVCFLNNGSFFKFHDVYFLEKKTFQRERERERERERRERERERESERERERDEIEILTIQKTP